MSLSETIQRKLEDNFAPLSLEVIDESEEHRGHGGWREGGETHFRVRMVSASLNGLSRVAQQRAVYAALTLEMADGIHALALEIRGTE